MIGFHVQFIGNRLSSITISVNSNTNDSTAENSSRKFSKQFDVKFSKKGFLLCVKKVSKFQDV